MTRERLAALTVALVWIAGGVVTFAVAAARGRDLGGPTGFLVAGVILGVSSWFALRNGRSKPH